MGALANALRAFIPQFWRSNGVGGLTSALDARTYQEHVADAVEQLEANGTASKWYEGSGAPAPALGQLYDQYLDNDTGDTWAYDGAQGWQRTGNLRGKDGRTPVKGVDYFDGRTPVKGVDYFDGRTPVKGTDYRDGVDGHTPVKGVDYFDGEDGSKYEVWDYPSALVAAGANPWRQRFVSPDPVASNGTAGVASFNTRAGAVVLTAQDVADVLRTTATVTFALVNGKLELTAASGGAALPSQAGHEGKYLKTDGTATSWALVPAGYTDNQAKAAAGAMAVQSATIAPTFDSVGLTLQFGVRPASLDASHFSPLFVSDGVFSSANKTKLETAGNWMGVQWNGVGAQELTGSRKFDTHADATYFYINIAPDNPIRLARA